MNKIILFFSIIAVSILSFTGSEQSKVGSNAKDAAQYAAARDLERKGTYAALSRALLMYVGLYQKNPLPMYDEATQRTRKALDNLRGPAH